MSSDVNAKLYEKLLLHQAEGRALFHPVVDGSVIAVGDCGYIKGGAFCRLFSVFDPPADLLVGTLVKPGIPDRKTEERPNPPSCFKSSEDSSIRVQSAGGAPFASFPVNLNGKIALSKKESSFAFLEFSQKHHQRDEWLETRLLADYLTDYDSIILDYFPGRGIGKGKLILLYGTTKVKGWFGGVGNGRSTSTNVQLRVDLAGQLLVDAGITVTHSTTSSGPSDEVAAQNDDAVVRSSSEAEAQRGAMEAQMEAQQGLTWSFTGGPANPSSSSGQDTDAALFPYCVVVCPVTVRWRDEFRAMFRLPVKATYPRSFLPDAPEPGGPTSQGSTVPGSSSLPTAAPNSSTSGTTRISGPHEVDADADAAAATDDADDSDDDDDSGESSDDDGPPDLLSSILDSILDVRPDIELAVGAWTAITGYATTYGSLPVATDCVNVIEPANNRDGKPVAHLARIEAVPAHHFQSPQDLIRVPHLEMTSSHSTDLSNEISDISPKPIARGVFSEIYRAKWRNHGNVQDVALKVVRTDSHLPLDEENEVQHARLRVIRQVDASKSLRHRNIIELLGTCSFSGKPLSIVMPFYDHGSIEGYLRQQKPFFKSYFGGENIEELRYTLMLQVMLGVEYLHAQGIVHADIRAVNVLVAGDGTPKLNLPHGLWEDDGGDDSDDDDGNNRLQGPSCWTAPELLAEGAKNTTRSDIWSCGCLFIEVESGRKPYHTKRNDREVMLALSRKEPPPRPDNMSDAIWAIASQCCNVDPAQRPSATEVAAQLRRLLSVRVVHNNTLEHWQEEPFTSTGSTLVAEDVPMAM